MTDTLDQPELLNLRPHDFYGSMGDFVLFCQIQSRREKLVLGVLDTYPDCGKRVPVVLIIWKEHLCNVIQT